MSTRASLGRADAKLPAAADIVIIGGGVMGLSTAYQLARQPGARRIVVIERDYLVSGASGRNGGGVRMQWADRQNVELMMRSIEICRTLAQQLRINLWFRQGGYLFLARTEQAEQQLSRNVELHQSVGAPTQLLSPFEAHERVPELDVSDVRVASFNPDDGVVFPWAFVWGYAAQAIARGVVVRTHTKVTALHPRNRGFAVHLNTGESINADTVVHATGAWCHGLNTTLGIALPNRPHRHEILSSEPLKPFIDPLLVDLGTGLYASQSTRGELVTGITVSARCGHAPRDPLAVDMRSSLRFLHELSRTLCELMPIARDLKVLRQWAGPYDRSPDGDPIVGRSPGYPDLIQLCGFTGHGFMMAPVVGEVVAQWLAGGDEHPVLQRWRPDRFACGQSHTAGETMVIG